MARKYTKEDLLKGKRIFASSLEINVLQDFFEKELESNTYIYKLDNGDTIKLVFDKEQFCHLVGMSYFGFNGIKGWNQLRENNILISKLNNFVQHKREEIRITNFHKILYVLSEPMVYLYKNKDMRYKSSYFAVYDDGVRYYKLGIGFTSNGMNYGETFQVSLMNSKDN